MVAGSDRAPRLTAPYAHYGIGHCEGKVGVVKTKTGHTCVPFLPCQGSVR
ncbi:MAG: hypothetical protein KatS3mg051_1660 [Anaerolineae bacterium]|nr:MAG: hypothetical protein KatS3mg051_1660 [Anaerolineae bacterium]